MATVCRYDRGVLRKPTGLSSGARRIDGHASRVGIFEYRDGRGGVRKELRLPEEVFKPESLASYDGAWITDGHPNEFVTPENAREYSRGLVTEPARRDGDLVAMSSVVDDGRLLKKLDEIRSRGRDAELSVGYHVDLDETPGNHPQFGRYDAVQRNIRVNHVAIVASGRAGRDARLRLDEAEMVEDSITAPNTSHRSTSMDPKEIEALKKAIATEKTRADSLAHQLVDATKRADELEGSVNALTAERDKLRATRVDEAEIVALKGAIGELQEKLVQEQKLRKDETDPKLVQKKVQDRLEVVRAALEVNPEIRLDEMTDREIMVETLFKIDGEKISSTRSDEYVAGCFKVAVAARRAWSNSLPKAGSVTVVVQRGDVGAGDKKDGEGGKKPLSFSEMGREPLPNSREARMARDRG